jgi:hypothetical protein
MAWWEWVPIVKTIGHAAADPAGRSASDYAGCACTAERCAGLGAAVAVLECQMCIKNKVAQYASAWTGSAIGNDFFETAIGGTVGSIGTALAKGAVGGAFLGLSATAWTGIGTVLAVDGLIDAGIIIYKLMDMYKAANTAIQTYCRCGDG